MRRSVVRGLGFFVAFVASVASIWFAGDSLVRISGVDRGSLTLDFEGSVGLWGRKLRKTRESLRLAFIGDSMLWAPPGTAALPDRAVKALNRSVPRGHRRGVHTLALGALTMLGEYCLADAVVEAKPSLLVLELNLRALTPGKLGAFGYPELAGWIGGPRLFEAAFTPLSDAGITLDRLLFYRFLVDAGLLEEWRTLLDRQSRLVNALSTFEMWGEHLAGVDTVQNRRLAAAVDASSKIYVPGKVRQNAQSVKRALGGVLDGLGSHSDCLVVLEALLSHLHRARVPVLVWVSPVNVEHLRSLGISLDGIDRSLSTIETAVRRSGADFVDLHALLPDAAFRDAGDHLTASGDPDGVALLTARLVPEIKRSESAAARSDGDHAVQ